MANLMENIAAFTFKIK